MDQPLTRRQRRLLKKEEQARARSPVSRRFHAGRIIGLVLVVGAVGAIVYSIKQTPIDTANQPTTTYTDRPVHWHMALELEMCGEHRDLPGPQDGRMVGIPLYHHHGDNTWHVEGRTIAQDDIKLGRFFDEHEIAFDKDRLMEKVNGDPCAEGGQPGQVKMFVNGEPNNEFRDYILKPTENSRDQQIRIVFE